MPAKLSKEDFIAKAKEKHGNKYNYSKVDYQGSNKKVIIICPKHGEFLATPGNHTNKTWPTGCAICCGNVISDENRLSIVHPDLAKEWDYNKNEFGPEKYAKSGRQKVWWICPKCNKSYLAKLAARSITGTGCPHCYISKGESRIEEYLGKLGIEYKREYRIPECKYKKTLAFDFAIWVNGKFGLIEYNGIQHYQTNSRQTKKLLSDTQDRDVSKMLYCVENNILLLIIKYTDYENIEHLIDEFLINLGRI